MAVYGALTAASDLPAITCEKEMIEKRGKSKRK